MDDLILILASPTLPGSVDVLPPNFSRLDLDQALKRYKRLLRRSLLNGVSDDDDVEWTYTERMRVARRNYEHLLARI